MLKLHLADGKPPVENLNPSIRATEREAQLAQPDSHYATTVLPTNELGQPLHYLCLLLVCLTALRIVSMHFAELSRRRDRPPRPIRTIQLLHSLAVLWKQSTDDRAGPTALAWRRPGRQRCCATTTDDPAPRVTSRSWRQASHARPLRAAKPRCHPARPA